MPGGPDRGHEAQGLVTRTSVCLGLEEQTELGIFCLFVYSSVCLIWAGDYFGDLQSHPFDLFFS